MGRFFFGALMVGGVALGSAQTTIHFDDFPVPGALAYAIKERYANTGAFFSEAIPVENVQDAEGPWYNTFLAGGGTGPNGLALSGGTTLTISVNFRVPGTNYVGYVTSFKVDAFDTEVGSVVGSITGYDIQGQVVSLDQEFTPASNHALLSMNANRIHKIDLQMDSDGGVFDNLVFPRPFGHITGDAQLYPGPKVFGSLLEAEIYKNDQRVWTGPVVGHTGFEFTFSPDLPFGNYVLKMRSSKSLWQSQEITLDKNPISLSTLFLINGDCNGDNYIGTDDYIILNDSFDLSVGDPDFDARADLDYDEYVGTDDYLILSQNFDRTGD